MPQEQNPAIRLVSAVETEHPIMHEEKSFERSAAREFVGVSGSFDTTAKSLLASSVQLEALMSGLRPGEQLIAHLNFASPKSSGLSVEIIGSGATRRSAAERTCMLGKLLDAALATGLPSVEIQPRRKHKHLKALSHACTLAPAGFTLPLVAASAPRNGAATSYDWSANPRDAIVFSPIAIGPHLSGLGAAMAAIDTELVIDVAMTTANFDASLLKEITDVRSRLESRMHADPGRYVRDERYSDANKRLENLIVAGHGICLQVTVRSRRPLDQCEISALSAALFGTPHDENQTGHLAALRSLYPSEDAVLSFFGIVAAAIGPALERSQVAMLDELEGNIVGSLRSGHPIRMAVASPRSHTYVIGRPGCGKTTLIYNMIMQDIENGDAVVLIDPHGDMWAELRDNVPGHRRADLQLVHMGDPDLRPKLNILELGPGDPAEARDRVVDTLYQIIRRMMYSGLTIDATGPMFNKYFRGALMLLLEAEGPDARIENFERIFSDEDYRNELRARPSVSAKTRMQWEQFVNVRGNDHSLESMTPWITSKLTQLTQSAILRPILNADTSDLNFDRVLSGNKICLVNLASGRLGAEATALLGGMLTHYLTEAAKRQECMPEAERRKASVYFDEFHTFATEFLRPLMAETRKYGLRVTLANQTLSQMVNNDIEGGIIREVLGNCANTFVFAVDVEDARYLAPRFGGKIDPARCVAQPNFQAICQFQTKAETLGPFMIKTLPPRRTAPSAKKDTPAPETRHRKPAVRRPASVH